MIRRAVVCLLTAASLGGIGACGVDGDAPAGTQITIAANPAGTNTYAVAAGMARVLQESASVRATIRPFSGSSVYIPMLQRGEITMGLNTSVDTYLSYNGLPPFGDRMSNLRLLVLAFPLYLTYMVNGNSDIYSVADLRDRRVVVRIRANAGLERLHLGILATAGLTEEDVTSLTVASLPDGVRLLTEGRADAVPIGMETALGLQAHSTQPGGIRYITMGQDEARLRQIMPASRIVTVDPGDSSVGIDEPTRVAEVGDYLNTGVHLPEEQAYLIVSTLHRHWETLRRDYPQLMSTSAAGLAPPDSPHPYHPGAIRYYREAGLWTDAHERHQAQLTGSAP